MTDNGYQKRVATLVFDQSYRGDSLFKRPRAERIELKMHAPGRTGVA